MTLLQNIEKALDQRLRAAFGGGRGNTREAIELYREALEEISRRTTPGTRGAPVFPFNRIRISLRVENAERKAVLETIFSPVQLLSDVAACLKENRAAAPPDLAIDVTFNAKQPDEILFAFEKEDTPEPVAAPELPQDLISEAPRIPARLVTLHGVSSTPSFDLEGLAVHVGRGPDLIDTAGRTLRRNNLFFPEDPTPAEATEINASVSRTHAHLRFDAATGGWRIYDDGSSLGTSIFRHGRRIDVPAHAARGAGLQPGDEIWLGHARLRFETYTQE